MARLVYGVGINDASYHVTRHSAGIVVWTCPFYQIWKGMLRRAYSNKFKEARPTYIGVTVCAEWHRFSNFKSWMEKQDWEGKQLDKDILILGNKQYSPEACCFVSPRVNSFMLDGGAMQGEFPVGVSWHATRKKFVARIRSNGQLQNLGRFSSADLAHLAWAKEKRRLLETLLTEENPNEAIANAMRSKYSLILEKAEEACRNTLSKDTTPL